MSKQSKNNEIPPFIESHWSEHPLAEWISNNKQAILWTIAALFALLIIAARLLMRSNSDAENDYLKAQTEFNQFQQTALSQEDNHTSSEDLKKLKEIMQDYPELHAKYDGALAQTLIIKNQISTAEEFARVTFKRTEDDSIKKYHQFAENSLVIASGNYQEALENALRLQEDLEANVSLENAEILYLFNLNRLAVLHQQLENKQEEAQIWEKLQKFSTQAKFATFFELFAHGDANIDEYIKKRKT